MRSRKCLPDFPPRSVEISGTFLRFKADPATVEQKIGVLDRWLDRASQKEASMAGRTEVQRQKKEELEREAREVARMECALGEAVDAGFKVCEGQTAAS